MNTATAPHSVPWQQRAWALGPSSPSFSASSSFLVSNSSNQGRWFTSWDLHRFFLMVEIYIIHILTTVHVNTYLNIFILCGDTVSCTDVTSMLLAYGSLSPEPAQILIQESEELKNHQTPDSRAPPMGSPLLYDSWNWLIQYKHLIYSACPALMDILLQECWSFMWYKQKSWRETCDMLFTITKKIAWFFDYKVQNI